MKSLSKFQVILLVVFGALAVSGVLIFALAVGGGSSNSAGAVVIWGTLDQNAFTTVIRQAAENNPQLSGVTYEQKDATTYERDLTDALANGQGPDIFILRQDYAMKNAGKVAIIPESVLSASQFEATFAVAALPFETKAGIEAIPFSIDPLVLYWNRDLLGKAGYAKAPAYWKDIVPMATYVSGGNTDINANAVTKRDDANAIKKSAIALGEYKNIGNAKDILATLILQAGGLITMRDNAGHLTPAISPKTPEAANSTDSALRYYTEFADPSKNVYSWNRALPDARAAFAAGDLGLYIGYASEEPVIKAMNPNLNFAVAVIPKISETDRWIDSAHVYGFAIARNTRNPSGAQIVAYLLASAPLSKNLSTALGMPSARVDLLKASLPNTSSMAFKDLGVNPSHDQVIAAAAIISRSWIDPDPAETGEIFRAMIEDTASGAQRLSDAIQRADQELGHILGL